MIPWLPRAVTVLATVTALSVTSCGSSPTTKDQPTGRVVVATTNTVATDITAVVGGDSVQVVPLVKPGSDPHDYEPTPSDLETIAGAAIVVRNGADLEPWFDDAVKASPPTGSVVTLADGIELRSSDGEEDPHIWHDPRNVRTMVKTVSSALIAADPSGVEGYRTRAAAFDAELIRLDGDIEQLLQAIRSRNFVSNHDAFGYFCARYGLTVVGSVVPSFDTQAENKSFAEKCSFPFPLMCDTTREIGIAYGAAADKTAGYPKRISYLIGPTGVILKAYEKVSPGAHPDEVLEDLATLNKG